MNKECAICLSLGDICVTCEEQAAPVPPAHPTAFIACNVDESCGQDGPHARRAVESLSSEWMNDGEDGWGYKLTVEVYRAEAVKQLVGRLQAVNAALQARLTVADQRIDDLEKDKRRLDALESEGWEIRHHSAPLADTGDYTTSIEIVGRWMDKPHERVIGENYNENLRAAIDQAMTADAYPPARPEYPEIDAALSDDDWQMNPCKQGHRDVGACGGQAFCHTCDETIIAATTLEAFEQWNATHPANPQ